MVVKLYQIDLGPPSRAVMMACEIFGVEVEYITVSLINGEHHKPEFLELNPCHTIPVLVDGDLILHDSHAILAYLADTYSKDESWYPKDVKQRALVNQKLFFNNSILFIRMKEVAYPALIEGAKGITQKQLAKTEDAYVTLEAFLSKTKYLAGDKITIADLAALPEIDALTYILEIDANKYPKTSAWVKDLQSKPYSQKLNAAGAKSIGEFLQKAIADGS